MQNGLEAGIEHGKKDRQLADIAANDPYAGFDYDSLYKAILGLDFPLLSDFSLHKDSSIEDVMSLFQL